jgi:hypothetical protein
MNESNAVDYLNELRIAAPCTVSWQSMDGDERVRHCTQCNKNVYNISDMSRADANQFLRLTAQGACVNFYKRMDGTVLVDNCPVGLRRLRANYRRAAAAIVAIFGLAQGLVMEAIAGDSGNAKTNAPKCNTRQTSKTVRKAGRPAISTPSDKLLPTAGEPMPLDPPAVQLYKSAVKSALIAAMPSMTDFGSAAISVTIASTGEVTGVALVNKSPNKATDQLIVKSVQKLKLQPFPKDFASTMNVYFECREAVPEVHSKN